MFFVDEDFVPLEVLLFLEFEMVIFFVVVVVEGNDDTDKFAASVIEVSDVSKTAVSETAERRNFNFLKAGMGF